MHKGKCKYEFLYTQETEKENVPAAFFPHNKSGLLLSVMDGRYLIVCDIPIKIIPTIIIKTLKLVLSGLYNGTKNKNTKTVWGLNICTTVARVQYSFACVWAGLQTVFQQSYHLLTCINLTLLSVWKKKKTFLFCDQTWFNITEWQYYIQW